MSFILDALKKSERERQRAAIPGLGDLPIVVHRPRTSTWVVATIAVLGLCVVALAWAWWQSSTPPAVVAVTAPTRNPGPAAAVEPVAATTVPATPPTTRNLATEAARVAAVRQAATAPARAEGSRASAPTVAVTPPPSVITDSPMSILEARARGMAVPELTLELLVFSDDPARRFAYINSVKYVEGDSLTEGPRVVEITPDGVVLDVGGKAFLLPQN